MVHKTGLMTTSVDRPSRVRRTWPILILLLVVLGAGLSYRLYLARYHTEVGIAGMAGWWTYVVNVAYLLERGEGLPGTLYAPGQAWAAYLVAELFSLDPAVLRVAFGAPDLFGAYLALVAP